MKRRAVGVDLHRSLGFRDGAFQIAKTGVDLGQPGVCLRVIRVGLETRLNGLAGAPPMAVLDQRVDGSFSIGGQTGCG